MKRNMRKNERGEAGVGTLIVFIAMVLVAAVAASVLIATASMLQQQSQETGMQATQDVAGGLEILSIVGDRCEDSDSSNSESDQLEILEVRVSLTSGSPDIDFDEMVIRISDGTMSLDMVYVGGTTAAQCNATNYTAVAVRDSDGSWADDNVITRGDLIKIMINTNNGETGLDLDNNIDVNIELMPEAGSTTFEKFSTPSTYMDRYIELV